METAVMKLQVSQNSSQQISKQQDQFLAEAKSLPVKSIDELIHSEAPALNTLDRKSVELLVFTCIGDYLNFIGAEMKDPVVLEIAQMMIDNHPHIPVDAIKSFFYEAKRGTYGFHYNKMDGTKLLMWYDQFVNDYYVQLEEMEYQRHVSVKDGRGTPLEITDEEGQPIDYNELLAAFHGKTKEQLEREQLVKDIRLRVQNSNMHLYNTMPVEEADKIIEQAIIDEMKSHNLLVF